ncbi:MAG: hypothetical protein ACR2QE_10455, partial [Acidimicrobiales bacterium]
ERVAREAQQFIRLSPDAAVPDYLTTGGYRDGLLAEQLDSWQTRLHKKVVKTVADTVGDRLAAFD